MSTNGRLAELNAEYRLIARRFREDRDPRDGRRLREIREEIAKLVKREQRVPKTDHEREAESGARRARRHSSAVRTLDHAPRECEADDCYRTFEPTDARQIYCSPACRKRTSYRNAEVEGRPGWGGQVTSSEPHRNAALSVTNRGLPTPTCSYCEAPFTPKRSTGRYCSSACRQAAYRERKRTA